MEGQIECYKCECLFNSLEEHGSSNIKYKNRYYPVHFCGECWEDEVDNSVEGPEGDMVWTDKSTKATKAT